MLTKKQAYLNRDVNLLLLAMPLSKYILASNSTVFKPCSFPSHAPYQGT